MLVLFKKHAFESFCTFFSVRRSTDRQSSNQPDAADAPGRTVDVGQAPATGQSGAGFWRQLILPVGWEPGFCRGRLAGLAATGDLQFSPVKRGRILGVFGRRWFGVA